MIVYDREDTRMAKLHPADVLPMAPARPPGRSVVMLGVLAVLIPLSASAQYGPGPAPPYPPPTLAHEFFLILAGAVFGGFLAPILMAVDFRLGISAGAQQQRENYAVQRDIAASLRQLVNAKPTGGTEGTHPDADLT
jgi:hypothetical protein